jgi:hypothetical protein
LPLQRHLAVIETAGRVHQPVRADQVVGRQALVFVGLGGKVLRGNACALCLVGSGNSQVRLLKSASLGDEATSVYHPNSAAQFRYESKLSAISNQRQPTASRADR